MSDTSGVVHVDGVTYPVRFNGFDQPLQATTPSGRAVVLRPLTCREYLALLGQHVQPASEQVELDTTGYANEVLALLELPASVRTVCTPLALWWAAAGGETFITSHPDPEGWLTLGPVRIRIRAWSAGEHWQALTQSLEMGPDGTQTFQVDSYLTAMLTTSIVETEPAALDIWELDAKTAASLVEAVSALNVPDQNLMASQLPPSSAQQMASNTLRLCRALGWTPSQVWATPASEVDALLALLDLTESPASAPPSPPPSSTLQGLAAHPEAVVIRIEDT